MSGTAYILFKLLKDLSVHVSMRLCVKLSDTPANHTIRSLYDSLNSLKISSKVSYSETKDIDCLSYPCVVTTISEEFCLIKSKNKKDLRVLTEAGKMKNVPVWVFQKVWTGVSLIPEQPVQPFCEPNYIIKDFCYFLEKYAWIIFVFVLDCMFLIQKCDDIQSLVLGLLSSIGIVVSVGIILQKKNISFQGVCKIGKYIDCNKVQNARYLFNRKIDLEIVSLAYFIQMFILVNVFSIYSGYYLMAAVGLLCAIASICWQLLVSRGICLFCILIDIVLIAQYMWIRKDFVFDMEERNVIILAISFGLGSFIAVNITAVISDFIKDRMLLAQKNLMISDAFLFRTSLEKSRYVPNIPSEASINNGIESENRVQVIVSLNCKHCAETLQVLEKLNVHVNIVFKVNPNDSKSKLQLLFILEDYLTNGIHSMYSLLKKLKRQNLEIPDGFTPSFRTMDICKQHESYTTSVFTHFLPLITINEHVLPRYYTLEDLKYLV